MFGLFDHPAVRYRCRHCGDDKVMGQDHELCVRCGPICGDCWSQGDCPAELKDERYERYEMIQAMKDYGGSFVQALSECFRAADSVNLAKLYLAFPEEVARYRSMAETRRLGKFPLDKGIISVTITT